MPPPAEDDTRTRVRPIWQVSDHMSTVLQYTVSLHTQVFAYYTHDRVHHAHAAPAIVQQLWSKRLRHSLTPHAATVSASATTSTVMLSIDPRVDARSHSERAAPSGSDARSTDEAHCCSSTTSQRPSEASTRKASRGVKEMALSSGVDETP